MLFNKPLDTITAVDLQALIDDSVPEGKAIDYKEFRIGNSDKDKKEFLADVSSFANASGGYLIVGVKEDAGLAIGLPGLQGIDPDAEILRLDNMVRDGIKPRVPGIAIRSIPLMLDSFAIVMHIPRSWAQPHVVDSLGHWRFYSRNSAGKYPLDVGEVRAAFAISESLAERIKLFRTERIGKIIAGETPIILNYDAKIVMHIVPLAAFDPSARFDLVSIARNPANLAPIYAYTWSHRHNFDGVLTFAGGVGQSTPTTYLQIFRNGILEAVESSLLSPEEGNKLVIPSAIFEAELIGALPRFLEIQHKLGIAPPFSVMLSLLGVAGYAITSSHRRVSRNPNPPAIDRDELLIPDILIEDFNIDAAAVLRSTFDSIWNACGWEQSLNYDAEGKWIGV